MKKRSRATAILLLPASAFIFLFGWAFYWIGNQKPHENKRLQKEKQKK
jgi:Tfp pilus assembly protein PilO